MNPPDDYAPGPATGAQVRKEGDTWTLILVRQLRHPPARVWEALTDPAHLAAWAPFDADRSLASPGTVNLTTVGAPTPQVQASVVKKTEPPRLLEYSWGNQDLRWELEATETGTRLTLWHNIDKRFIAWGAAGWHLCLDVMDRALAGKPLGRIVGPDAMKLEGWQRLVAAYGAQFEREGT